jgi:hypothetical protein
MEIDTAIRKAVNIIFFFIVLILKGSYSGFEEDSAVNYRT